MIAAIISVNLCFTEYNYPQNTNNRSKEENKCAHTGPSIHAGPKAFAAMTGLGSDGKPHPHAEVPVCKYQYFTVLNFAFVHHVCTLVSAYTLLACAYGLVLIFHCNRFLLVLQDQPSHITEAAPKQSNWDGPKVRLF